MFFKSIRFKIILLYMLMSAATLSLFSVLLYKNFSYSLFNNLDSLLKLKAAGIVSSIEAYWEAERSENTRPAPLSNIRTKINNVNFIRIADRWIRDKSAEPDLVNLAVHIYDAQGRIIASSKDLPDTATMRPSIFEFVLRGTPRYDNFRLESDGRAVSYRALTTPVIEGRRVAYIVQVASSIGEIQGELNNLKAILLILIPTTVLLTGIAGSFLVKVTLRPVDDMVRSIREIKADNLKTRLSIPNTNDEIKRLAETYNEMLERIEAAFNSQKRFNQDVSHELKTPLTVLKGELEVTLKKNRSPQEYAEVLKSCLEEIDKIRLILDNLLLLARFDNREIPFETQKVELQALVEKVVSHLRILADQKGVELRFEPPKESVTLDANEMQLRRLFTNLVENAIKYTPAKGLVVVRLGRDSGLAVAEVSDTGMGIPDNELPFIFDRFYRVDKARSSEGFGLGLSISKSIAEAHQGDIKVKSRPGAGTTFTVFLPTGS